MRRRWSAAYTESFPFPDEESLACGSDTHESAIYSTNQRSIQGVHTNQLSIRRISHLFNETAFY